VARRRRASAAAATEPADEGPKPTDP
jgi:hypothetical protein